MESESIIIDVREPFEYRAGHAEGALNIPLSRLQNSAEELEDIDKDTHLIVYCRSGGRSSTAIQILEDYGFTNLSNGINAHQAEKHKK